MSLQVVPSPTERVRQSYKLLTSVATTLNSASDRLGKSISELEAALKRLGLGVSSHVRFKETYSADGLSYDFDELWYTKIGGKWGLAIRSRSGHEQVDEDTVESWPFNEAPRLLRVKAVKAIPDLLDQLIKDANEIAQEVNDQSNQVDMLAGAIHAMWEDPKGVAK